MGREDRRDPSDWRWAGQAGRAYNSRTGVAAAGRSGEIGNVCTGRDVKAGQGVVRGPGGNTSSVAGIKGNDAGIARIGDDVYAGHDGHVYGDSWEPMVKGANGPTFDPGQPDERHPHPPRTP